MQNPDETRILTIFIWSEMDVWNLKIWKVVADSEIYCKKMTNLAKSHEIWFWDYKQFVICFLFCKYIYGPWFSHLIEPFFFEFKAIIDHFLPVVRSSCACFTSGLSTPGCLLSFHQSGMWVYHSWGNAPKRLYKGIFC